jgi:peptide/nickel transport system ATP-binding protein
MSQDVLLEIEDLRVSFYTRRAKAEAVRGVSLFVRAGETLGLVGESGSGKSVTMQAAMGLIDAPGLVESGQVRWRGKPVSIRDMQNLRGRDLSMVFQDAMTSLNPLIAIGAQLDEVLRFRPGTTAASRHARAIELLQLVGIDDPTGRLRQLPHEVSGGMRQRIMIAMALAADPQLLIADEPTTALDVTIQAQIVDLLVDLRRRFGLSILLVTHDLGLVAELCDRVAVMYAGRIVETAPVQNLFAAPAHPYTAGLLRATPRIDDLSERLETIAGNPPDPAHLPGGCAFRLRCPRASQRCADDPGLVDIAPERTIACWHPLVTAEMDLA